MCLVVQHCIVDDMCFIGGLFFLLCVPCCHSMGLPAVWRDALTASGVAASPYEQCHPLAVVRHSLFLFACSATENLWFLLPARAVVENSCLIFCEKHRLFKVSRSRERRTTLELRGRKYQEIGESYIMRSFTICFHQQILKFKQLCRWYMGRVHKFFKNPESTCKFSEATRVTRNMFHTEDPQIWSEL